MPQIQTLIKDIQHIVTDKKGWFDDACSTALTNQLSTRLHEHFNQERYDAKRATLRLSAMGPRCPCALWFSINHPEMAERLPPWAEVKFSFGHILEVLAITFAKAAGHEVTGEQDELVLDGIVGHRDCVIDGYTVDVKSSSSLGFSKFKTLDYSVHDTFGYLDQLDGYVMAAADDPLVRVKDKGYILAIDKTLGHMTLYKHEVTDERRQGLRARIQAYKHIVGASVPPPCECRSIPDGASGNLKLDTKASYSPYKYCCNPGLRTFLYKGGPVYLTRVVRRPDVKEVNRFGKVVYH